MGKKHSQGTSQVQSHPWKRSLISSAIALAGTTGALQAQANCATSLTAGCSVITADETITISSTGVIDGAGSTIAITVDSAGAGTNATINNSGQIANSDNITALGYTGHLDGSLNNESSGSISASGSTWAKTIDINGDITGTLNNKGGIYASASTTSGASAAYAYGISADGLSGSLSNSGEIGAEAYLSASGYNLNATAYGVELDGYVDGNLSNSGQINASAAAFASDTSYDAHAAAIGIISGDNYGSISNSGNITVEATADATGSSSYTAMATAIGIMTGQLHGDLENTGTITASAEADIDAAPVFLGPPAPSEPFGNAMAAGLFVNGSISNTGSLVNNGDIISSGNSNGAGEIYGIAVDGDVDGTLHNKGDIDADLSSSEFSVSCDQGGYAAAMQISGQLSGSLINSGTLDTTFHNYGYGQVEAFGIDVEDVYGSLTNTSQGVINVSTNTSETQSGLFNIASGISAETIHGTLENAGEINVSVTAPGLVFASGIEHYAVDGSVVNSGEINVNAVGLGTTAGFAPIAFAVADGHASGYINGSILNTGSINADATLFGYGITQFAASAQAVTTDRLYGSLTNEGTISANATAYVTDSFFGGPRVINATGLETTSVDGVLTNNGEISAEAMFYGYEAQANVTATAMRTWSVWGEVINNGDISASINGTASSATAFLNANGLDTGNVYGSVTNNGAIDVVIDYSGSDANHYAVANGLEVDTVYGSVVNNGSIGVSVSAKDQASAIGLDNNFELKSSGTISNHGDINVAAEASSGEAYAYGISLDNMHGFLLNTGSVDVTATASTGAYGYGITANIVNVTSTILNLGDITVNANDLRSNVYAHGIYTSDLAGGIINDGSITAIADTYGTGSSDAYAQAMGIRTNELEITGTIANTGEITVTANGYYPNSSSQGAEAIGIYVNGDSHGTIINSGTINASASNLDWAEATGINVDGQVMSTSTITNDGAINVYAYSDSGESGQEADAFGMELDYIYGTVVNNGTITALAQAGQYGYADAYGIEASYLYANASMVNNGTINVTAADFNTASGAYSLDTYGMEASSIYGSIINNGTINASSTSYGSNNADAYGMEISSIYSGGSLENHGAINVEIHGDAGGQAYGMEASSIYDTLINTGMIDINASVESNSVYAYGIETSTVYDDGSIENSGAIMITAESESGDADAYAYGIEASDIDGHAVNTGLIDIRAQSSGNARVLGIQVDTVDGAVTNSGDIFASASSSSSNANAYGLDLNAINGIASNTANANIVAMATGLTADAFGIYSETLNGTLQNAGSITVSATASLGDEESGLDNASAFGVFMDGSVSGTFLNSGSLNVSANTTDGSGSSAYAFGVSAGSVTGQIVNTGSIDADAQSAGSETAYASGLETYSVYGSISNAGTLSVSAIQNGSDTEGNAYAYGIRVEGSSDGSISNTGDISAYVLLDNGTHTSNYLSAYAFGIYQNGTFGDADIVNNGTITAIAESSNPTYSEEVLAYGIYVSYLDFGASVTNNGTINAYAAAADSSAYAASYAIYVNNGTGMVTNNGTINGSVITTGDFENNGTHNLTLQGGNFVSSYIDGTYDSEDGEIGIVISPSAGGFSGIQLFNNVVVADDIIIDTDEDNVITSAADDLVLYEMEAILDGNTIDILLARQSIDSVAEGSVMSLAKEFESAYRNGGATGEAANLLRSVLNASSAEELNALLEQNATPVAGGQTGYAQARGIGQVTDVVFNHLSGASTGDEMANHGAWVKAFGADAERDQSDEASGYEAETTGFVIGWEADYSDGVRVGTAFAITEGDVDDDAGRTLDADSVQIMAYADWDLGEDTFVTAQAGFGFGENTATQGSENADYDTSSISLSAAYGLASVELDEGLSVRPVVKAAYISVTEDEYALGMAIFDETDTDSLEVSFSGDFVYNWTDTTNLTFNAGLGWDVLGDETDVDAAFADGSLAYSVESEQDEVFVTLGAGLEFMNSDNVTISIDWDHYNRGDYTNDTVSAKVNYAF